MKKERNSTYELRNLEEGDRFYFFGDKKATVYQVSEVNVHRSNIQSISFIREFTTDKKTFFGEKLFKKVIYLRNINS